jgi:hypothetical protein
VHRCSSRILLSGTWRRTYAFVAGKRRGRSVPLAVRSGKRRLTQITGDGCRAHEPRPGAVGSWDLADLAGARVQLERTLKISDTRPLGLTTPRGHPAQQPRPYSMALGTWKVFESSMSRALEIGEATLGARHSTVTTIRGNLNSVL